MEIGLISLLLATAVGFIQLLGFLHSKEIRKEQTTDRYAKADRVALQLTGIEKDLRDIENISEDHSIKINALQSSAAVLVEQMRSQISSLEKLADKLDDLK